MIASTAPLVDRLLLAESTAGTDLHPMIVTGAGTTISTCWGLPSSSVSSWPGMIATALGDAAKNDRAIRLFGKASILAELDRCKGATSAEELLELCDKTCDIYLQANLDLSQWIYDKLTDLGLELEMRIKDDKHHAPLLSAIRDWQASFGAVVATTNYDRLLTIAHCGDPIELYETPLVEEAATALADVLAGAPNVIHLHGRYDRDRSSVFSSDQYRQLMSVNVEPDSFARRLFNATLPIFVGCGAGLADQDLSLLIGERSPGPAEVLKRAIILHKSGDAQIAQLMREVPFDTRCVAIAFGDDHADLVPFLEQARRDLLSRGFRGRRPLRGSLRVEAWLKRRREHQAQVGAHVAVPPLRLAHEVRELPFRRFAGTLLRPRVPTYELQAIAPAIDIPDAEAALHEDARFDPIPLSALHSLQFVVLLGDGGSGKTALTKHILARAADDAPDIVAAHLRVADYFRSHERFLDGGVGASDLWQFLLEELRSPGAVHMSPPPVDDLERALVAAAERGAVLVILDGLDEVSRLSDRAAVVAEALRLHDRLMSSPRARAGGGQSRLILTSRFSGYRTAPVLHPSAQHLVLCPLLPTQVGRLHNTLFTGLIAAGAESTAFLRERRRALRSELAASALGTASWIDTPLMAVLVAVAFLADGKLPKTREALFDTIVRQGCSFVIDRAEATSPQVPIGELRGVLEEAAFRIFSLGTHDALSKTSLEESFRLARPLAGESEISALVAMATSDESLLRERGADHFAFVHRGVLEYLCGCRLHTDPDAIADKSCDPSWRQPASFATGIALSTPQREKLVHAMTTVASIANGYRPLLCLLRGALYAARLSLEATKAVARAMISGVTDLGSHVSSIEDHRSFHALLRSVSNEPLLLHEFEDALVAQFQYGAADTEACRGALLICEGLDTASPDLVLAIDSAASTSLTFPNALAERVQRLLLRRRLGASDSRANTPLIPFGAVVDGLRAPLSGAALAAWRRGIAALSGGIADIGHAEVRPVRMNVAKLLAATDERRNLLIFTLAEHLRDLSLAQQEAIARKRLEGVDRVRSLQDVMRELRRHPDVILGLAYYLDNVVEPILNDQSRSPALEGRHIYRTPLLARQIEVSITSGVLLESLLESREVPVGARHERAILAAIAGQSIDSDAGPSLELAMHRVADGAVRSLLAVQATLSSHGAMELQDQGHILADAVVDLKLALNMPARFDIGASSMQPSYEQRNFRDGVARTITGEGLNPADDVYNAMVIVDVMDATKRVSGLVELGHSSIVGRGHATWDIPPLPLPHLHETHATILGEAIDNLEAIPSAISAFRSDTLRGLSKIEHPDAKDVRLELEAALSQDWGAQAIVDEAVRYEAGVWRDRTIDALDAARAAGPSLWKARALSRLLRLTTSDQLKLREQEIARVIEEIRDPFEQVLAYEHLAERAHPVRGQAFALLAFQRLMAERPFPPRFFQKRGPTSLESPELCARAYARLSVWLPSRQRDQALVAAVGLAGDISDPWTRTVLLRALAPYVRHSLRAQRRWDKEIAKLPSFIGAHCAGESGAVLCHLVDRMLSHVPELANGEADPIVAYALLRDARRRLGKDLTSWEVLERAECSPAGAQKVRQAFESVEVPRMSAAGLIALRAFCEAGMSDVAAFVLSRVPRHPPGSAAVIAEADPDLAQLIHAIARGMDASSASAVAAALFGDDDSRRALALAILEPAVAATLKEESDKPFAPFTCRRASVEGIDSMLAFARLVVEPGRKAGPLTVASRYVERILLETSAHAERLVDASRVGDNVAAARWLLASATLATPQFLRHLVALTAPDEELAPIVLVAVAQALNRAPVLGRYLDENGTSAEIWSWFQKQPQLKQHVYDQSPAQAALFLKIALRLDPEDMDTAYMGHQACSIDHCAQVVPALAAWGSTLFIPNRPEVDQAIQAAGVVATQEQRTLSTLAGYCAWDARAQPSPGKWKGLGYRSMAWPLLASCVEQCPATLQALMHGAAMFEDLPGVARSASSWVTRRSAFRLMPLEWHVRPARVSFDVIESALAACDDVWQVQEAALAMVGSIRSLDNKSLDLLYTEANRGGLRAIMAFRMINAILINDRTPPLLRQHAQLLAERALNDGLGDRLIEHGIATTTAPPRMRLREVLLQQLFADA